MNERAIPPAVIADQHAASDPSASVWVSANAGAGKTHVLAQRVIRLLLDGTDPAKILCLTFTKAASANMANRVFNILSHWTTLDDAALDKAIASTGAKAKGDKWRARARQLFALALETPGGLKVQTIHGFCTRLLQQFPFEANVAARFRVLEDVQQKQMLERIRRDVLLEAANNPSGPIGQALAAIIPVVSDFGFQEGLNEAIAKREPIAEWLDHAGGLDPAMAGLSAALGIAPGDTLDAVEAEILDGPHLPSSEWRSVAAFCAASSSNDQKQGRRLADAAAASGRTRIGAYLSVFLTDGSEFRKSIITGGLAKKHPELAQRIVAEQARMEMLCGRRRAIMIRDRTRALLTVATEVSGRYAAEKDQRGLLDYNDLIARTRDLLGRYEARWVHYKLDLGIDHVLIDEAQDTSPDQWDIIKKFVAEFTAGAGARSTLRRSIFAVGDDKQSIFSFQGAAPEAFAGMRSFFEGMHAGAEQAFRTIPFKYSFRSVPTVLEAVDIVFRQPAAHAGLTVDPVPTVHEAVRALAPGLVELWKLIEPDKKDPIDPWDAPFDKTTETNPRVKLARQIAVAVKTWIARGDMVGDGAERHPLRAGDVLILVRQRGVLFESVIRALKNEGVPVAGADRLILTDHIAVMDLLVLADAVLLPEDDLALATVLKSPLVGLSEDELFALAFGRKGSLHATLREQRADLSARLDAMADDAHTLSPFAFYARLLSAQGGRKAFLSRLGPEANDALDEFLNLALDYESRETPSLQGFVSWMRTASAEIKRDMEIARDEVRVMTVHGAKGLEAPVVVLADTTTVPAGPAPYQPRLLALPVRDVAPGTPDSLAWMPNKRDDIAPTAAARALSIEAAENEHSRLLYVAMTRAADRLVVCGAVGENTMPPGCWYDLVSRGLEASGVLVEEPSDFGTETVLRFRKSPPEPAGQPPVAASAPQVTALPAWLTQDAPPEPLRTKKITPSRAIDHAASGPSGIEREKALARGTIVHRLMQSLPDIPPERRKDAALKYLARQKNLTDAERDAIANQALTVLVDLRFAALFEPGSRAEVPMVGRLGDSPIPGGVVDRLVVTPAEVLIADYKTNHPAPRSLAEVPPAYLAQLAIYCAVLRQLYPDRPVRAALLWTDVPDLMEIPAASLDTALAGLTSP